MCGRRDLQESRGMKPRPAASRRPCGSPTKDSRASDPVRLDPSEPYRLKGERLALQGDPKSGFLFG
jgi:hypothetical protein